MCSEIRLDAPNLGELEKRNLNNAIDSGYVSTAGPFVSEFELRIAGYLGAKKAISTQSGTSAIHLSLYELGIGKGDEVIVPALTFVASVNPVMYVGATPVFVDVDIDTWNMDPEKIKKSITKNTKAIIPVHFYGNPCDMDKIMEIAEAHDLYVIEDAAESLGAKYKLAHTGTFGDFGCFSFNGNKIITTGGGGMIISRDGKRLDHIKFLINQARNKSGEYYHSEIGFNNRMTNVEAALGLAQMEKLEDFLRKKRAFSAIYRKELKGMKQFRFQEEYKGAESSWWLPCVTFHGKRNIPALQEELKKSKIPTRRVFMPVVEFPPYKKYNIGNYDNSYQLYEKGLCLPASTLNSEDDICRVCEALKGID